MMTATLSIIIPCYNVEDYVQAALQSILDNTSKKYHNRLQLLIINDGSTDQTWDKIQEWLINLDNLSISYQLINQPNAGLSAARNAGMAQATGNYWLFLDSDDIKPLIKLLIFLMNTRPILWNLTPPNSQKIHLKTKQCMQIILLKSRIWILLAIV